MELARWLIVGVALVIAIGGLLADYFIPSSGKQHIKNPHWPPHAKFHNAQTILMGLSLGVIAIAVLFRHSVPERGDLVMAALLASLYWLCIFRGADVSRHGLYRSRICDRRTECRQDATATFCRLCAGIDSAGGRRHWFSVELNTTS